MHSMQNRISLSQPGSEDKVHRHRFYANCGQSDLVAIVVDSPSASGRKTLALEEACLKFQFVIDQALLMSLEVVGDPQKEGNHL